MHVDIKIMVLYCSYLGHSRNTVLISNLQFKTKSGKKYWEIFTKGISFDILSKESRVRNTEYDTLTPHTKVHLTK